MKAGAALDNMGEAWWAPTLNVPGEEYDGRPMARHVIDDLALPGSILVNRHGRRFVNEATNYNDLSKAFHVFDPSGYETPNVPAWLLFDAGFKSRYTAGTIPPSDPAPAWIERAATLAELAGRLGIDAAGLAETVTAFNEHAAAGADPAFGRGASAHDRYYGDATHAPNPCLAPLATPPFYAIKVLPGSLGTKSGIVIDADGRALDAEGEPIPRLYACGNATASVMGVGYPGAGGTLGPALAFAYACGRDVARIHEPAVRA
jgi:succinate dehydrogenase/fumarate reductase flavoprotein subunit